MILHTDSRETLRAAPSQTKAARLNAKSPIPAKDMEPSSMLGLLANATPSLAGRKIGALVSDGCDDSLIA